MAGFCRGCVIQYNEPTDLLQYTEKNRRLFVYATGLQVKRNDTFTFQLCKECYFQMKQSCKFKKQCRNSDKKFKNYLMLKEDGDNFGSFIKNMDENLSLRLPLVSGHSTPAYHKNKDDDNESTCTSIRNFMTDILEGEEMAPTEARIIREVIEEEADVLDDSLDSHWLQDDMSVTSDFDADFGINSFATPRYVNNGSYTPRTITDAKQREINYLTSKEIIEKIDKPRIIQKFDMPLLDMGLDDMSQSKDVFDIPEIIKEEYYNGTDENEKPEANLQFNNSIPSEVEDMVTENSLSGTLHCFKVDLFKDFAGKKQMDIENDNCNFATFDETEIVSKPNESKTVRDVTRDAADICIVVNQGVANIDGPLSKDLDYYVNKTELKRKITSTKNTEEFHCTIDRNLAIALKSGQDKEFSVDQLIVTPAVSVRSAISTPTINNILFGEKDSRTPCINNILFGKKIDNEPVPKYFPQVGQSIDDLEDNKSNILENLLKSGKNIHKNEKPNLVVKTEPESILEDEWESKEMNNVIKSESHIDVLEDFLREADDDTTKINEDIIDQIIDPEDINKELSDQDLFKRPLTPPYDKYDLDKCLCKICQRPFTSLKSLKIHFAKTHNYKFPNSDPHRNKSQNSKVKLCDICGKDVKGAANYLRHMRSHDEGPATEIFQCDVCTATYKSRMALKVHLRVHTTKAPVEKQKKKFVCETCGKISGSNSHHKLHMRRHLKQISASCDICNQGFYSVRELNVHVRITHNFERPFKCPHCPNSYKRSNNLNQHLKQHLGIMLHKCDVCNVQFVTATNLASHFKSIACIMKRKAASRREKEKITVQFGKGSIDRIKKMMESRNPESINGTESSELQLMEAVDQEKSSRAVENEKVESDVEGEISISVKLSEKVET